MRTTPVPQLLLDGQTVAEDAHRQLEQDWSQILPGTLDTFAKIFAALPMDVMPMSLRQSRQEIASLASGNFSSNAQEGISNIFLDARMAFDRAYGFLTVPRQEKISLTKEETAKVSDAPPFMRTMSRFDYDACKRIEEATNEHRWDGVTWTRNLTQTYTGGMVAIREKEVTAFLVREWQYKDNRHLLLNVGVHPNAPEDGRFLMQQYLEQNAQYQIAMAVRERRDWLWKLLRSAGFWSERNSRNHYRFQDDFEDAMIMTREP